MKVISFTYTKADKSQSLRTIVALAEPSKNFFGIDISELDIEDQAIFINELEVILENKKKEVEELMEKYDIRTNYRTFCPDRMSDIQVDI